MVEGTGHIDVLEQRDSLQRPLLGSILAHALLFSSFFAYGWLTGRGSILSWGTPNSQGGGGSVAITPVNQIPLPSRGGLRNPVASDSESLVPAPPKQEPKKAPKAPEPDAIPIKGRPAKVQPKRPQFAQNYKPQTDYRSNQIYSGVGQKLSSPFYGSPRGSGGVGIGPGSAFGNRFGYYRDLLERAVAQKWRTDDVDPRMRTAPIVVVTFEIQRTGQVRDVRIEQGSGIRALDYSAQRAIYDAAPFPPLPAGFERDSARIEFQFQLQR